MVADLVAPERDQAAYASVRVASNVGVVIGPPIGGLLLVLGSWSALFPTVAVLSAIAWLIAFRYLPQRGEFAPEGPPAPADIRGAYMGAFGSAPAIGFALAPLIGLQVRNSFGDEATWALFAVIGVVAAVLGGLALAGLDRRARGGPSAVLET
jgi:MFS family permease